MKALHCTYESGSNSYYYYAAIAPFSGVYSEENVIIITLEYLFVLLEALIV